MALLNDIRRMQSEGTTEQEIISNLRQQGISTKDIIEALSQSKIKEAVGENITTQKESEYSQSDQYSSSEYSTPTPQNAQQEAFMNSREVDAPPISQIPSPNSSKITQEVAPTQQIPMEQSAQYQPQQTNYQDYQQDQSQDQYQPQQTNYQDYQQYPQGNISPDTITEISEQVVTEKLSSLKENIEQVIDMKTNLDSRLDYLDERLKKIEKIIDRLNLSIMQKVGDYMTNIDDIKKELIETQKSFKSLVPALNSNSSKEKNEKSKKSQINSEEQI